MRLLVTGGAGFIGSNLVDELVRLGHKVIVVDNLSGSNAKLENINPKARFYKKDIRDLKSIQPLFRRVDFVFHLAARARIQPSIINPKETLDNNVNGTLNVLLASRDAGVRKVIYSASSSAYGDQKALPLDEDMLPNPKNPYALSKLIGEELCRIFYHLYRLPTVSLRYFNVYGPRQPGDGAYATVIGIFLRQKANKEPLTIVGKGIQKRDFTHVFDVVRANILAMKSKKVGKGEVINIGTGKNYSVNEVAEMILSERLDGKVKLVNFQSLVSYLPPRPAEAQVTLANNKKAKTFLGWQPMISFEKGIANLK